MCFKFASFFFTNIETEIQSSILSVAMHPTGMVVAMGAAD